MSSLVLDESYHDRKFKEDEIIAKLSVIDGIKTFGDIDVKDVFHSDTPNKGTLGNLMEVSVLGMKKDSLQQADLEITYNNGDVHSTELKTTGVHDRELEAGEVYHAKECTSLTAVSIGTIEHETWEKSHYYNKLAHLLWVFYFYKREAGQDKVPYAEYARFPVLGYKFTHIVDKPEDLAKFKNDWLKAQAFIIEANKSKDPESMYPALHSAIKKDLFYVDIAPRYQKADRAKGLKAQTPRFRIKKSYVNSVFQEFWNELHNTGFRLEHLEESYASFEELDRDLHDLTKTYKGYTVERLISEFGLPIKDIDKPKKSKSIKSIAEQIAVKMVGCNSKKISNIDLFNRIGIIAKTITLTTKGTRTEDTKLFTMNLDEIRDNELPFEETSCYQYFNDYQFLCIVFEEPSTDAPLKDNKFVGFKRFVLPDELIEATIREVYGIVCNLVNSGDLTESYCFLKDGTQIFNKNGVPRVSLNFPKSKDYTVFVRGTGKDSSVKNWVLNGHAADGSSIIRTYPQQFWIKGKYITDLLASIDYI